MDLNSELSSSSSDLQWKKYTTRKRWKIHTYKYLQELLWK